MINVVTQTEHWRLKPLGQSGASRFPKRVPYHFGDTSAWAQGLALCSALEKVKHKHSSQLIGRLFEHKLRLVFLINVIFKQKT